MVSEQSEKLEQAKALFASGQMAFERGNYREAVVAFEAGTRLAGRATALGGTIQLWLMNAYSAANRQQEAIALGDKLVKHPDREIRKQSKRVVEILQAPKLKRRADWTTPIPDLSNLESSEGTLNLSKYGSTQKPQKTPLRPDPQPENLSQMNTRDNGFLGMAIAVITLAIAGIWFFR
ncbi:MAG: hypothetical protein AAFY20_10840 [Cyanobacteria bacterium J06639_14]